MQRCVGSKDATNRQFRVVPIAQSTVAIEFVKKRDAQNVLKVPRDFALHTVVAGAVPFQVVTKAPGTSSFEPLMGEESAVPRKAALSLLSVDQICVLLMAVVAVVRYLGVSSPPSLQRSFV